MEVIARIHNDFPTKFGLPRQSGLAPSLRSKIVFEPAFRVPEALRGLEGFSHIWLIWGFSESEGWSPTVRPPRLGGNVRMGVFATRSPFRPNPIGLSSVRLEGIETDGENGLVLIVDGADLMDGTPIYDIKPYLPGVDAHPEATDGFVGAHPQTLLTVQLDPSLTAVLSAGQQAALREILAQDPRPAYHAGQPDSGRIYGLSYAGRDIHFTVCDGCIKAW
jgi:tRNA-Thr(GGU) m(6)t(6)A37 methyltransferase TsaA